MKNQTITIAIVFSILVVVLAAGLFVWHVFFRTHYEYEPLEFSKEAWAAANERQRGYMVKDLLENHELKGMTYDEVVALLGRPDLDKEIGVDSIKKNSIHYDLGYMGENPRVTEVGGYILDIEFSDNKVTFCKIAAWYYD